MARRGLVTSTRSYSSWRMGGIGAAFWPRSRTTRILGRLVKDLELQSRGAFIGIIGANCKLNNNGARCIDGVAPINIERRGPGTLPPGETMPPLAARAVNRIAAPTRGTDNGYVPTPSRRACSSHDVTQNCISVSY